MASKNNPSPSKNTISSWFKSLKKSDSQTEQASFKNNLDAKIQTNNNSNLSDEIEPTQVVSKKEDKSDANLNVLVDKESLPKTNILHAPVPTKSRTRKNSHSLSLNILSPQKSPSVTPIQHHILSSSPTPSRPFLGFKSRSSHSFRPLSQFLDSSSSNHVNEQGNRISTSFDSNEKLRTHRDSFLQQKHIDSIGDSTIFGCDIEASTKNAYGTIYISADIEQGLNNCNDDMKDNAYGKVPLVIVACGSFLKSKGLKVEGIFRLAGSNKRVKQLQIIFSSPPDYGAKINWDGYTVHDAASLLRRYLSSLVEPLIPLDFYDSFRDILIAKPELLQHLKNSDAKSPIAIDSDLKKPDKATKKIIHAQRRQMLHEYADLFQILPPIQKRVLFYLLDLLAMFSMKSEFNRMPAKNLAAIFQPSILSHPSHDMNPEEYAVNSLVIESMITYSHKILINIQNEKREQNQLDFDKSKNESIVLDHIESEDSSKMDITNQEINLKNDILFNESAAKTKMSSSNKGSPLKHMITPLEQKSDVIELNGVNDTHMSSFSDRQKILSRPHSKSVSLAPHSEVLRVATDSVVSVDSKLNKSDERLSTTLSYETDTSSKSLSILNVTEEVKKPVVPESLNLVKNTELDIAKYQNVPDTPTMDTILKQQITPTHSNELKIQNNDIVDKNDELENKHENELFHDCKSFDTDTNNAESVTSSSFSFQPSLLQGHISRQQSELSINQISDHKIGREISEQQTEATAISKDFAKDFDGIKFTNPEVIAESSGQLGNCSSSSNDIDLKTRSDSSAAGGKRTSTLFSLPHKIGMNINKSESSSEKSSPTTPTKEKRNWFDKLKPRSNTKH